MWFLKLVLADMSPTEAWKEVQKDSTALVDAELARKMTTGGKGLLARAPGYIQQELLDVMEMFSVATATSRRLYQHLASHIKTPSQGLVHNLEQAKGGWEREMTGTLRDSFYDLPGLRRAGLLGAQPNMGECQPALCLRLLFPFGAPASCAPCALRLSCSVHPAARP